ncbi:toll/interleukin-1 receptor domain-containing protein [Rheinheimera sp.]|uniref:toll/interleukin-1 receptor domain-containing protein n=1 Tax=Rheinheimera sp. TaxID=1869214 RepID=UPI002FDD8C35
MSVKVFISYSHKDESFKDDLIEHMAGLTRSGAISEWNDRKILPGQDWSSEISDNLTNSQLILFLISSSFMSSEYCFNVEAQKALELHKAGKAKLIPIVIRPVDWGGSELATLQGLPKDADPISSWSDSDAAWLNVIKGIKNCIAEFKPKQDVAIKPIANLESIQLADSMIQWMEDTEIVLTHRKVDKVLLSDIYTIPDLEMDDNRQNDLRVFRSADFVFRDNEKLIICGEEQQGKTSLLKFYFKLMLKSGLHPIIINGDKIKDANVEFVIGKVLKEQYIGVDYQTFVSSKNAVVLIDNIDEVTLNKKFRGKFLDDLNNIFSRLIYTAQSSFSFVLSETPSLDGFIKVDILGLGNKKREELIQRWISLGIEQTITDEELYRYCDELKEKLNSVVKKNIVPSKPIYVLMLLQMFEAHSNLNLELSSHGHCYQQLIYQTFKNAKINDRDFEKYLNVLTELAWWIFKNESNPNENQLDDFFKKYKESYLLNDTDTVLRKLVDNCILSKKEFKTGFKYPYIYYFFVGKKIAESYADDTECKAMVLKLLQGLHREDFANIIIFITHHTKDSWVLTEINLVLDDLFVEQNPASLDKNQLCYMDDFMKQIPELVIEQREIQQERDRYNEKLDLTEREEVTNEDSDGLDVLANINKTFKGMEIAGQIIKNRHASLKIKTLSELASNGIMSGLRFLSYFIAITDVAKNEIVKVISAHLSDNPSLTDREMEKLAENAYLHMTYGVINGMIRKIATSVGSKEAIQIYDLIASENPTPALQLLKQSIDLHFNKRIDIKSISKCVEDLSGNFVCSRILRELVVQHIYMFPVEYQEKQQLSKLLGLSVKGQHLIEQKQKRIR